MPLQCSRSIEVFIASAFRSLARVIARRPGQTILASVLFACVCAVGFARLNLENRAEKLWIPQDTEAQDNLSAVEGLFGDPFRIATFFTVGSGGFDDPSSLGLPGDNVLTKAGLLAEVRKLELVAAVSVTSAVDADAAERSYTLDDLCYRAGGSGTGSPCATVSVLDLFGYTSDAVNALADDAAVLQVVNAAFGNTTGELPTSRANTPIQINDILGGVSTDASGRITGALALRTLLILDPKDRVVVVDGTSRDRPAEDWEEKVADLVFDEGVGANADPVATAAGTLEHREILERSIGDSFEDDIQNDSILLAAGFVLLIVFTAVAMGRFDAVESRVLLALSAVLSIGLAISSTIALASLFGLLYSPFHTTLVLLLLGLGVDDAFIIVSSFDSTRKFDTRTGALRRVEDRTVDAVAYAGSAVLVTSLTDAIAFSVGSATNIPAIRSYALYAAIGVIMDFVFQITFFVACVVYDARRQARGRRDVAPCVRGPRSSERETEATEGIVRYIVRTKYAPRLLTRTGAVIAAVLFLSIGGLAGYGVTKLEKEFNIRDFVKDGSRLREAFDADDAFFTRDSGLRGYVYFTGGFDYAANEAKVLALPAALEANEWIETGSTSSWFTEFVASRGGSVATLAGDPSGFAAAVSTFLATTEGRPFSGDVVIETATTTSTGASASTITGSRIGYGHVPLPSSDDKVDAMLAAREVVESQALGDKDTVFAFSNPSYLFFEQFRTIGDQVILNVCLTIGAIGIVSFVLIGDPLVALYVIFLVCWCVLVVYGIGGLWDIAIDAVTAIVSVISIGLLYDALAHEAHAYVLTSGDRRRRTEIALTVMGPPVLAGSFSTFLAIILTAGSQSFVFRVFFKLLFLAIASGSFCALVVLPVLLWLAGPQSKAGAGVDDHIERSYEDLAVVSAPWPWRPRPALVHPRKFKAPRRGDSALAKAVAGEEEMSSAAPRYRGSGGGVDFEGGRNVDDDRGGDDYGDTSSYYGDESYSDGEGSIDVTYTDGPADETAYTEGSYDASSDTDGTYI